jgi:hypothetical protein
VAAHARAQCTGRPARARGLPGHAVAAGFRAGRRSPGQMDIYKHIYTKTIKFESITSNETKNRQSFAPSPPPPSLPSPLPPLFSFFRIIMTFSAKFRCYIGVGTLALWATTLGGLLPPWAAALRPDAVAHGARPLTLRRRALRLGHARGPLLAALASRPTALCH